MRIAVFGSGGYIGRHLVTRLQRQGHFTLEISTRNGIVDANTGEIRLDMVEERPLDAGVYLAQGRLSPPGRLAATHAWAVNVTSAVKALQYVKRCGGSHFLYASSGNVYAAGWHAHPETDPLVATDLYSETKIRAEEMLLLNAGDTHVSLARFFTVFGGGQTGRLIPQLIDRVREGAPVTISGGPQPCDSDQGLHLSVTFIEDAVTVVEQLLAMPFQGPINVCSTEPTTIREIATILGLLMGRRTIFEPAPTARTSNLMGDSSSLVRLTGHRFQSLDAALEKCLVRRSY